jgi:hypothetical protein
MPFMRSSLLAIAILAGATSLAAGGLTGCKKKEKAADQAAEADTSAEAQPAGSGSKKEALKRLRGQGGLAARLGLEPVTIAEVKPLIPALTGATPLGEPTETVGGRRVTAIHCLSGTDAASIKGEMESKLAEMGFSDIRANPRGKRDVMTVSAQKGNIRLAATLRVGPYPDCPAEEKKIKVLMSYFKRAPKPGSSANQSPAPSRATPAAPGSKPAGAAGSTSAGGSAGGSVKGPEGAPAGDAPTR